MNSLLMKSRISRIVSDPSWAVTFLLARTMMFRQIRWNTKRTDITKPKSSQIFPDLDCDAAIHDIRAKGIYLSMQLPPAVCSELANFCVKTPCFANFSRNQEFYPNDRIAAQRAYDTEIISGHYFERIMECRAATEILEDPYLNYIAKLYLGYDNLQRNIRAWWTFPAEHISNEDMDHASFNYHFDLDAWRSLKFFFYLSDVDEGNGPHVYITGSHSKRKISHQISLFVGKSEDDLRKYYGSDSFITISGRSGQGFAEDPFGFHRGTPPRIDSRLMLEVNFSVL